MRGWFFDGKFVPACSIPLAWVAGSLVIVAVCNDPWSVPVLIFLMLFVSLGACVPVGALVESRAWPGVARELWELTVADVDED